MPRGTELDEIAGALDHLLRLNAGRKVHTRLTTAAGVVISQPGALLLRQLRQAGPLTLGSLADACHMDPAATGRQVADLEDSGFVERRPDTEDARVTIVELTRSGRAAERKLAQVMQQHLDEVIGAWSATDRRRFADLLTRLVEDLRAVPYRAPTRTVTVR